MKIVEVPQHSSKQRVSVISRFVAGRDLGTKNVYVKTLYIAL